MPIHEFKCKKCGMLFEAICLRIDEKDKAACPSCGGNDVEPLISTFSLSGSSSGKASGTTPFTSSCSSSGRFS
ncbi:MAG: FmdB family zinc ribbon protein [Syntrophobacteraceae bacterium]